MNKPFTLELTLLNMLFLSADSPLPAFLGQHSLITWFSDVIVTKKFSIFKLFVSGRLRPQGLVGTQRVVRSFCHATGPRRHLYATGTCIQATAPRRHFYATGTWPRARSSLPPK